MVFAVDRSLTLAELTAKIDEPLEIRSGDFEVRGLGSLENLQPGQLCFVRGRALPRDLPKSGEFALVVSQSMKDAIPPNQAAVFSQNPERTFAKLARVLYRGAEGGLPTFAFEGIHPSAVIEPAAELEEGVSVEPLAVIGGGAKIGRGTRIGAGAVIGEDVSIGRDCYIGANSTLHACHLGDEVVIGFNVGIGFLGFGLVTVPGQERARMPHIGELIIQRDVHIGSGTMIDRSTLVDSVIGEGTRIDAMVRIGHNCQIGRHVCLCSGVGLAGGTRIEDWVTMAASSGAAGHLTIGKGSVIGPKTNLVSSVPEGSNYLGFVGKPKREAMRELAWLAKNARK